MAWRLIASGTSFAVDLAMPSSIIEGLRRLDAATDSEFADLQRHIARTFETEPGRRDSLAAAVTCANLVASTEVARDRITRILRTLELIEERITRAAAAESGSHRSAA